MHSLLQPELQTRIQAFVDTLSLAERNYLLSLLSFDSIHTSATPLQADEKILSTDELLVIETWLYEHLQAAKNNKNRLPRLRIWGIFIFLRYAGLRLQEIFTLGTDDLLLQDEAVSVSGANPRTIYLPSQICHRVRALLHPGTIPPKDDNPLRCDPGYLRRTFQKCSAACQLGTGLVNARTIRLSRLAELNRMKLPVQALQFFSGARKASDAQTDQQLTRLLKECTQKESLMKTSARNLFRGRVTALEANGFMVRVHLKTAGGLSITAIITDTSNRRLQIVPGSILTATVKAPFVSVHRLVHSTETATGLLTSETNCFPAQVETVRSEPLMTEITAVLPDGSLACSLQETLPKPPEKGERVFVHFKALAVVLHRDLG